MAEVQEVEIVEKKATEKSIDPRLDDYINEIYERFAKAFPEFTPEQLERLKEPAREEAARRIKAEDSADNERLTGLLTKDGFYKNVDIKLRQYQREIHLHPEKRGTLRPFFLLIDVDGLKTLNDTHGHIAGDQVLSALGQLLQKTLRPSDIKGRFGGDEFVVLLGIDETNPDLKDAVEVAARLKTEFGQLMDNQELPDKEMPFQKLKWPKSFSIGVAQMPLITLEQIRTEQGRMDLTERAINLADMAQYHGAKLVGKNRIGVMLDNGQVQTAVVNPGPVGQPPTISYTKP